MGVSLKVRKAFHGLRSARGRKALRLGVAATIEHERILRAESWKTIIDIGANVGQFALAAIGIHPDAVIHSFEPLEGPARKFSRLFADAPNVHLHPCAIGAVTGSADINISARDDSSSLLPISDEQVRIYPGTQSVGKARVEVRRLSDILRREDLASPSLLKADVQGYEYAALLGSEELLPYIDAIYVECSLVELYKGQQLLTEVAALLRDAGFSLADIGDLTRDEESGSVVQGDFLFRRTTAIPVEPILTVAGIAT